MFPNPEPFSAIQAEYQSKVELLLAATSFQGLTSEQLFAFQSANSSSVYICRFPGCTSIVTGFASLDSRAKHEKAHVPRLRCMQSGCKYRLAFGSVQSLQRHVKNFHEADLRTVPRSIRRNNFGNSVSRNRQRVQGLAQMPQTMEKDGYVSLGREVYNYNDLVNSPLPPKPQLSQSYTPRDLLQTPWSQINSTMQGLPEPPRTHLPAFNYTVQGPPQLRTSHRDSVLEPHQFMKAQKYVGEPDTSPVSLAREPRRSNLLSLLNDAETSETDSSI
jgi:hypothetical protein